METRPLNNRDSNWLYFNERVLLEAANTATPLLERLTFLAIFSSNLDEFFKVRISQLRQLKSVDKSLRKKLVLKANKNLKFILKTVESQQKYFGQVIGETLSALEQHQIYLRKPKQLNGTQKAYLSELFKENIQQDCGILQEKKPSFLKDGQCYLAVHFDNDDFDLVAIPTENHDRFVKLPGDGHQFIFLDDVLKTNLHLLFPDQEIKGSYAIKMSRDAELYLEDDYNDTELVERIYESLGNRKSGQPTRLLYDMNMPAPLQASIKEQFHLGDVDMLLGGEYHNLSDFFGFPQVDPALLYAPKPPLKHPVLSATSSIFDTLSEKDQLVHFPYQEFDTVENFIQSAASDSNVTRLKMTLYRIAKTSALTDAILTALENGKEVVLFVEAKARFDEENNIMWGRIFKEKGARVIFSVPNIKVHSKVALVERNENGETKRYGYIGTGNFNAKTAKIYCDHGLLTANQNILNDLSQVFLVLERKLIIPRLRHLVVSPFTTRQVFLELIENEITNARLGKKARITAKMNSLEDSKMIFALYKASEAGVEVRLLVRGFCCLITRQEELKEHEKPILVTSIVDRYLEHGRIYLFENGGEEKMYIGSADWMTRNLDKRIEVLAPILDASVFQELKDILEIQLNDNVKARLLGTEATNITVPKRENDPPIRSQYAIYDYLKAKLDG
ncbi:MAG: polyphosphate kinase 1 [Bacteroidota bacterium]